MKEMDGKLDPVREAGRIHNGYLPLRASSVPFPAESVAFFCIIFALQRQAGIVGDLLEVGVQHGGTAFLSITALGETETQVLIDLKKTPEYLKKFELLSENQKQQVVFLEGNSHKLASRVPIEKARFIHIDGGHLKADVLADLVSYHPFLARDGVLAMDDVFEIRWPGVTEAVIEMLPRLNLKPFAFVNRKLYSSHADMHAKYLSLIEAFPQLPEFFGSVRKWKVKFLDSTVLTLKIAPRALVASSEI